VAPVLAELGWDGALRPPEAADAPDDSAPDYLALVNTNMGYNKANAAVEQALAYTVTWPSAPDERPLAEATVIYTHTFTGTPAFCAAEARYFTNEGQVVHSYDDLVNLCYFGYVRLYVPSGSELVEIEGVQAGSASSQRGEKGTRVFAGYLNLEPGEVKTVTIRYRLPAAVGPEGYTLRIQRQSGTAALPVALDIGGIEETFLLADGLLDWQPPEGSE
jgi:hypothetical protein